MNALIPLPNMVETNRPKQCLQHSLGPNRNPIAGGSSMAEIGLDSYHIESQVQTRFRGVLA